MSTDQKIIKHKVGLLMGDSRDTFYRYKAAVEDGGFEAIIESSRRKPNRKNRVPDEIEQRIVAIALDKPLSGRVIAKFERCLAAASSSTRPSHLCGTIANSTRKMPRA